MNCWKMKELAELLMEELNSRKGSSGFARFLRMHGYDTNTLADMGFSESFLYGFGMSVEDGEVAAG